MTALERLLSEIRKGYVSIGDTQVFLPKTVDLKMELEEKDGRVEFELELKWPLQPQGCEDDEAGDGDEDDKEQEITNTGSDVEHDGKSGD